MRSSGRKYLFPVPVSLASAQTEQDRIARTVDRDSISEDTYKGAQISINDPSDQYHGQMEYEVRYTLRIIYYNKCAYCESLCFKPDVEHYRPKLGVSNPHGNNHGYYWLAYEWSNLLPACRECNSANGKWNKFPIFGTRLVNPPFYANGKLNFNKCHLASTHMRSEKPKLFNPEVGAIEPFIKLDWGGKLHGRGRNLQHFESTIQVCDLNRGNLVLARKKIIEDFTNGFEVAYVGYEQNVIDALGLRYLFDEKLRTINTAADPAVPFSIVALYIKNNFQAFVDNCLTKLDPVAKQFLMSRFAVINP